MASLVQSSWQVLSHPIVPVSSLIAFTMCLFQVIFKSWSFINLVSQSNFELVFDAWALCMFLWLQFLITHFSEFQLACVGTFFLHEGVFFLSGLPYMMLERSGWLSKYKIQVSPYSSSVFDNWISGHVSLDQMLFFFAVFIGWKINFVFTWCGFIWELQQISQCLFIFFVSVYCMMRILKVLDPDHDVILFERKIQFSLWILPGGPFLIKMSFFFFFSSPGSYVVQEQERIQMPSGRPFTFMSFLLCLYALNGKDSKNPLQHMQDWFLLCLNYCMDWIPPMPLHTEHFSIFSVIFIYLIIYFGES